MTRGKFLASLIGLATGAVSISKLAPKEKNVFPKELVDFASQKPFVTDEILRATKKMDEFVVAMDLGKEGGDCTVLTVSHPDGYYTVYKPERVGGKLKLTQLSST